MVAGSQQVTIPQINPLQADNGQRYSLSGTVVNSATGEPVPHALVQFFLSGVHVALSGPDGRFRFDNLPGGAATISAQKPGFFSPQELGVGQAGESPYPVVQVGKETGDIAVKLMPAGSISGKVTNSDGEPVSGVQVRIILKHTVAGQMRWEDRANATTDDSGSFRSSGLFPGDYYVATVAHGVRELAPFARPVKQNSDEIYSGLFFPGTSDVASATPVRVEPGQQVEADFSLRTEKAYRITGAISGGIPGRTGITLLDADGNQVWAKSGYDFRKNEFRFFDVPPGAYRIIATSVTESGETMYGITDVGVSSSDVSNVDVNVMPSAKIPVQVQIEGPQAGPAAPAVAVHLAPRDHNNFNPGGWTQGRHLPLGQGAAETTISNVMPGRYRVEVQQVAQYYISSVRSGNIDLTRDDLVIAPGSEPAPIEVVLHGSPASLRGTVKAGGEQIRAFVLVLPDGDSADEPQQAFTAGQFSFSGLAPGSYHVYAFPSLNEIEYENPDAMKRYADRATQVTLSENESKDINVDLITGGS
ncbi:MAG TPA: carboxypeptidase-like regulatory domain-containing protein [Bryobacteraceae bacterium]|nr:carboxypeptidase-like regulatory domain-containing protein [Bryobacteraceae bacterium]